MPPAVNWGVLIEQARVDLMAARATGDELKIDLAESVLNDTLDQYSATLVTCHNQEDQA